MAKKREKHLKPVSRGDEPLPDRWLDEHSGLLSAVRFARKPTNVETGDLLVLYASGKQKLFGVVRSTMRGRDADEAPENGHQEHPWRLTVQARMVFPDLRFAPDLSEIGVAPQSVMKADKVLLEDTQYEQFLTAVANALR